jgi:hypothetical protein
VSGVDDALLDERGLAEGAAEALFIVGARADDEKALGIPVAEAGDVEGKLPPAAPFAFGFTGASMEARGARAAARNFPRSSL